MYPEIREEELKNQIAQNYFVGFDCSKIIGNIDFCVTIPNKELFAETLSVFWAEAKKGNADIYKSLVQLILTIGKARTFDKMLPPPFLGAFDAEKIAFLPYNSIQEIFYQNDFNWNVAPSNHETKEFKQVHQKVKSTIENNSLLFFFKNESAELKDFIQTNFVLGNDNFSKIKIDKNNFFVIYNKWLQSVKPSITIDWTEAKKAGIIDGDFYLADLLSSENQTLREKLYVILKKDMYELDRTLNKLGMFSTQTTSFRDKQKAHRQFWGKYERPPKEEYWDYIVNRRDLLVPQDIRERKGSFFTPQIWVELSQKYLAEEFGENWQDDYFIWDCAAGTGNLLNGLTNKYNIFASTLDRQDVDVMKDRIQNGANLLENHVFQFDFLNDSFEKLPENLQEIIKNPEKRKKLIIYINPPYAEASNRKTLKSRKEGNRGVEQSKINEKYASFLGQGNAELFAQFLTRIYFEIPDCKLAQFSKLKILSGQHFIDFRNFFLAKLHRCFVMPADTFDNVNGQFPIGFMIWDTAQKEKFKKIKADIYNRQGKFVGIKNFYAYENSQYINDWIKPFRAEKTDKNIIGKFPFKGNDFQNQNLIALVHPNMDYNVEAGQFLINQHNLIKSCIYFAVRKCIKATWLNDRDQFLFPNKKWEKDKIFQTDCLTYTLFNNNIQSKYGVNHWIPFTEQEVQPKAKFVSNFMTDFMQGKIQVENDLFKRKKNTKNIPLEFSDEAKNVFEKAKKLWIYYHQQADAKPDASFYDIKEFFQGRNEKGKMNNKSQNEDYEQLLADLKEALKILVQKIEPKIYEYGFLLD